MRGMQGIKKARLLCVSALICLIALVVASPAAALYGESDPLLPNTGNIRGTVTDENGTPIDNLEVCAMTESSVPSTFTYCTRTEEGGQYLVYDVPEGNYKVWAHAAWYLGFTENYPQAFYAGGKHPAEGSWVPVTGEQTTTGIDFQVHEGGEITGTVTEKSTGNPIANVEVCPHWVGGPEHGEEHSCGFSNSAGEYLIRNVDTDEYTVEFDTRWAPGFEGGFYPDVPNAAEAEPVDVIAGQATDHIDAHLSRSGESTTDSSDGSDDQSSSGSSSFGTLPTVPLASTHREQAATSERTSGRACKVGLRKARPGGYSRCVKIKKKAKKHHHPGKKASHR